MRTKKIQACTKKLPLFRKFTSAQKSKKTKLLTSNFIHDRLYYPKKGYFTKKKVQLGHLEKPIEFDKIFGYEDYSKTLAKRYPENAWLTPSEIFKPWYGMSIANYLSRTFEEYKQNDPLVKNQKLKIIEIGAGNGSAAESILDYFRAFHPIEYQKMEYSIVEISGVMAKRCEFKLLEKHSRKIKNKSVKFVNESVLDYGKYDKELVFVVMLELLDNMPHDRVYEVS